eukprot:scaffold4990_cov387-Prasinococcus_capsulatus_cf.AAC.39
MLPCLFAISRLNADGSESRLPTCRRHAQLALARLCAVRTERTCAGHTLSRWLSRDWVPVVRVARTYEQSRPPIRRATFESTSRTLARAGKPR